ncbi:hypothetical protein EZS27_027839, partial [termite gut metagenome]
SAKVLNTGNPDGEVWLPAETDVSIRPGWFYSPETDTKIKSVDKLTDIYYTSIGRNSNLILNVPPNREGRISPADSIRLIEFRKAIDESFADNLAKEASIRASETRNNSSMFKATNLLNKNYDAYWATNDETTAARIELEFPKQQTFNRLLLQEYIPLGQRVAEFSVEYWNESAGNWTLLTQATTIGYKRILRFSSVTSTKIRINIEQSLACPVLNNIEVYKVPE